MYVSENAVENAKAGKISLGEMGNRLRALHAEFRCENCECGDGPWECTYFMPIRLQCICHKMLGVFTADDPGKILLISWNDDGGPHTRTRV